MSEFVIRDAASMDHYLAGDSCYLAEVLHPERLSLPYGSFSLAHALIAPGGSTSPHKLIKSAEIYYIISGSGRIFLDGEPHELRRDRAVMVPPSCVQHVENGPDAPLVFLCLVTPPWRAEDEVRCQEL